MKDFNFFLIALMVSSPSIGGAVDLEKGLSPVDESWSELTSADREAGFFPKAVVSTGDEGIVYTFDGSLGKSDYINNNLIGSWPLTRWVGESSDTKFNSFTLPYTDNSFGNELRLQIDNSKKGIGCLNESPLRYGDINNDQSHEVVLLLGELNHTLDLVVFSPEQEKTIFGARLALHDSQDNEYGDYSNYDYISTLDLRSAYQAYRSYAKVFLIDLDADKTTPDDIVVWRKAFLANHKDNPVKGFSLDGSLVSHFAYEEGEYALQETSESDIQKWLTENDLTWSKGYPSKSECPGEEGQLIPEMHDPLLNDPDVLH